MESSQHIDAETDLNPVFGQLADDAVREQLRLADERLQELCHALGPGWASDGVILETLPSGQASVHGEVRSDEADAWFTAELRPRNYFSEQNPWRPGQPPRPMQTDAWKVDAVVQVRVRKHVLNKKYTFEETAAEIETRSFSTAVEAAAGLVATIGELADLAQSREPTAGAWSPDET
jgi:hypothetical protein